VTLTRAATLAGVVLLAVAIGVTAFFVGPLSNRRRAPLTAETTAPAASPAADGRKIKVRLFYLSDDGMHLTGVERDVPFAEGLEQARAIILAQLAPVAEPLLSAVPPGTSLRALFITDRGDAYVDLSHEISAAHTGGTLDELLTVYTIVDALTTNLPAVQSVQILVDGKEVPTLAGHVDVRQPLVKNLGLVQ
jgi:germination protein M